LNFLCAPLSLYQKSGLQSLFRSLGLAKVLPKHVTAMDALLPILQPAKAVPAITPAVGPERARVGLLLGCVQRAFFSHVNAATVRVLAAEGCQVVAPSEQPCCGALFVHAGEEAQAQEKARKTIDAFEQANVDTIITNAAGCGSTLKEYGRLLADDRGYAERAKAFAAKCKDISEFLCGLPPRAILSPLALPSTIRATCSMRKASARSRALS